MPIQQTTPPSQIDAQIQRYIEQQKAKVIETLKYIGERCVIEARTNGSYHDQTGNLRSSIGYAVVRDGRIVSSSGFDQVKQGSEGVSLGKQFLNEIISKYSTGITLVVVAGMNYAAVVESRGLNVASSSELLAKELVPKLLKQLSFKLSA